MANKKPLQYAPFIVAFVFVVFVGIYKFAGWSWSEPKTAIAKYSEYDYSTIELEKQWDDILINQKGNFTFQQIKSYLQDTLTDPEEFKMEFLIEKLSTTDTLNFAHFAKQLLEKETGKPSVLQQLYTRLNEEIIAYSESDQKSPQPENRASELKILKLLFQNPKRNHDFMKQGIIQFGEWNTKADFSLDTTMINKYVQEKVRNCIILPLEREEIKSAEERFSSDELDILRRVFTPVLTNIKGVVIGNDVREYLSGGDGASFLKN